MLPAIAATIGAAGDPAVHIGAQRLLLVLDNFEQVIGAAPSLSPLLSGCPNLVVLVTSRERLHLAGEVEVALQPLDPEIAAKLFAERAGRLGVEVGRGGG